MQQEGKDRSSRLKDCLKTLRFLSASTEGSAYVYDVAAGRVYFADAFDETYHLPPLRDGCYPIELLMQYLHCRENRSLAPELMGLPEEIRRLCHREYWLTNPIGDTVLLKNEIQLEYTAAGRPLWVIGRLWDAAAARNVDTLTGLFDREKLMEDLKRGLRAGDGGYLMILGIDNFRDINTRNGRRHGNQVLRTVAELLEAEAVGCGVYRLEADGFAIHMSGGSREDVQTLYARIQSACAPHCALSAGVAAPDATQMDAEELFQQAEYALTQAKQQGKNRLQFYSSDLFSQQVTLLELQDELRSSVMHGCEGFFLTYQPQMHCGSYELFGAEALLRFRSPTRGLVRPDEFLPVLEQTGLILPVGDWVLETALNQCRVWREQLPEMHISINVSYIQLRQWNVAERILAIVERSGVPGSAITLEVTESMQLQDFQRFNQIFYKLEKHGIQIAIDDFGTGYSSLSYLKRIAIHEVKIDRCFVSRIQHSAYNYRLLSNMIELARSAQMRICCEGVETEDELGVLRELAPDLLQGYLFAKPCEPAEFEDRYLNLGSESYHQSRGHEASLRSRVVPAEVLVQAEQDQLSDIVDSMDELVYVRATDSYELLYMNARGRELTGVYDYRGQKCHQVLMGQSVPCADCQNCALSNREYSVREYWNSNLQRHFMLKEKQIPWKGRMGTLTVAIDVTEKEITTNSVRKKLEAEANITRCSQMLMNEPDIHKAIAGLLEAVGEYYEADWVCLMESGENGKDWERTHSWRASHALDMEKNLGSVPDSITEHWLTVFRQGECVVLKDVNALARTAPELYVRLVDNHISSVILAPVWCNQKVVALLAVYNPHANGNDSGQAKILSCFLADRVDKDETKGRLNELLDLHHEDILKVNNLGLWVIRLSKDGSRAEMYADQTMRSILGIRSTWSPEECYDHWYSRINAGYYQYVSTSVQQMLESDQPVELRYTWMHPVKGETTVRSLGTRVADQDGMICLKGYHREINEVAMPRILPEDRSIVFEFNENKQSVYFHNTRGDLAGEALREEGFPQTWVESGIVHPHFAARFVGLFTDISHQKTGLSEELLLRTQSGNFEWFKLQTQHLSSHDQDVNTMIATLTPATQERATELELQRLRDFYRAVLSEKIAYAEIDMESGHFLNLGGMWSDYADMAERHYLSYDKLLDKHAEILVHPEDLDTYRAFISRDRLMGMLRENKDTEKMHLRRIIQGQMCWVELTSHVFRDELTDNCYALLYIRDIDAAKRRELDRELAATRDPLTKVFNRESFEEEVSRHMLDSGTGNCGTLLLLDIDDFKQINDTLGHVEGDRILRKTADILMATFRAKDLIGRFGGDEFVIFLKNVVDKAVIDRRVKEFRDALSAFQGYPVTCSVGAVEVRGEAFSYDACLHKADMAMYRSKQMGKNALQYYDEI